MSFFDQLRLNAFISLPDLELFRQALKNDWDSITIDMQHGLIGIPDVLNMLTIAEQSDKFVFVRLLSHDQLLVGKLLDLGASGIIWPNVDDAPSAQRLVDSVFYKPKGMRSFYTPFRSKVTPENAFILPMIESKEAVENLPAICKVPGISAILIGPADLWVSYYGNTNFNWENKEFLEILKSIASVAKSHHVYSGTAILDADDPYKSVIHMNKLGYLFITPYFDVLSINRSNRNLIKEIKNN
ncbi:MAG: aldolase/citrate lyase family protein [Legionellaceae bacterium]|nr:aldolase/citrate lyase family protein [Legionellaceae bacterium]